MRANGQTSVRNDEEILLVGFCIRDTLEKSGKWVGEEKGSDDLHCYFFSRCDDGKVTM